MNNRIAFEIKMTPDKLLEMLQYAKSAQEHMCEGQTFRLEVSYNVDFVFAGLKPFKSNVGSSRDSEMLRDLPVIQ
jgi:hypothetical protein